MALPVLKPGDSLGWDEDAASLAEAQSFTYRYYLDMSATGNIIPNVQVVGETSPFQCSFLVPAIPEGKHRIELTAANDIDESARSLPFDFAVGAAPASPKNVHIVSPSSAPSRR